MEEHIAYAMRNADAIQSYIYFNNPFTLKNWTFNVVETTVFLGAILGFLHSIREYKKRGNKAPFFLYLTCVWYGIFLEVIVYNFVDNFWHGEFSVMFYHNRFPLYILLIYPSLIYHVFMTIERHKIYLLPYGRFIEAIIIGWASQMMYLLYDNIGPHLHWWIWNPGDVTLQPMWEGVPATSYHWIFGFTVAFAWLCRVMIWDNAIKWKDSNWKFILSVIFIGIVTNIIGSLIFGPYNFLAYGYKAFDVDVPYGMQEYGWASFLLVVYLFLGAYLYFLTPKVLPKKPDLQLMLFPVLWCSIYIGLYAYVFNEMYVMQPDGITQFGTPIGNWIIVLVGMHMSFVIVGKAHLQGDQLSLYQFKEVFRDLRESFVMIFRVLRSYIIPGTDPHASTGVALKQKKSSTSGGHSINGSTNGSTNSSASNPVGGFIERHIKGGATGLEPDHKRHFRGAAFQNVLSEAKPDYKKPRSAQEYAFREQYCEYDAVPSHHEMNNRMADWREQYVGKGNAPATSPLPEITKRFSKFMPGFGPGCEPDIAYNSGKKSEIHEE